MYRIVVFLSLMFPFAVLAEPHGCGSGINLEGRYIASKGKGYLPSSLVVAPTKDDDTYHFDLEAYWAPKPNDDGSHTTQGIFAGQFSVRWCVGHYVSEDRDCFLVFNFAQDQIKVTSFGLCPYGNNAYPDEKYFKRRGK